MTRSADWWAGWQEAIASACDACCRGCRDALPIDPERHGRYHKTGEGTWVACKAESILKAAEVFRQAVAEARGWDSVGGED